MNRELKTIKPIKIVDVPQISRDLSLPPVTQDSRSFELIKSAPVWPQRGALYAVEPLYLRPRVTLRSRKLTQLSRWLLTQFLPPPLPSLPPPAPRYYLPPSFLYSPTSNFCWPTINIRILGYLTTWRILRAMRSCGLRRDLPAGSLCLSMGWGYGC